MISEQIISDELEGILESQLRVEDDQEHEGKPAEEVEDILYIQYLVKIDPEQEELFEELGSGESHLAPHTDLPLEQLPPLHERLQLARQQLEDETPPEIFLTGQQVAPMNDCNSHLSILSSQVISMSKFLYRTNDHHFANSRTS